MMIYTFFFENERKAHTQNLTIRFKTMENVGYAVLSYDCTKSLKLANVFTSLYLVRHSKVMFHNPKTASKLV